MRIVHLSDLHFGGEDSAAIAAVTRHVKAHPPDLVVVSGDLSFIGLQSELDAAFAWLASLGRPVIATPGNHDVPYHEVLPRIWRPFRRYETAAAMAGAFDAWDAQDVRILTINTARGWQMRSNWALGAVSEAQLRRGTSLLGATAPHALKIVVTHHPLMFPPDSPLRGQTRGGNRAARKLVEAGAQVFLSGHLHTTMETRIAGRTLSLGAGTLSLRLRGEAASFLALEWQGGAVLLLERYIIVGGDACKSGADTLTLA